MGAHGLGLGKKRTRLGRFLDRNGITQGWLEKNTGLGEATVGRMCGDIEYRPTERTKSKVVSALQKVVDDLSVGDFW